MIGRCFLSVLLFVLLGNNALGKAAPPERIVSINLCTDALLMTLAPPDHILAISYLSRDPVSSAMVEKAKKFPTTRGTAAQIIALNPDLIVTGAYNSRHTVQLLQEMGYPVVIFESATDIASTQKNIRKMGVLLGQEEQAEKLITRIENAVAATGEKIRPEDPPLIFANYNVGGWTSGKGSLLADIVMKAGFIPLADKLGFAGTGQLSLERLILARPDLIDLGDDYADPPSVATELFTHPALIALMEESETIALPARQTLCGTPAILETLTALSDKREKMLGR